jgi:gamma-glutamyltranspeptidase/glutathione hydrolase
MSETKRFTNGCVASPHYLASAVGLSVLAGGGNALDAAIATNLTLAVVSPYMCGYGGDLFAIVWDGNRLRGYNGSGRSPAAATLDAMRSAAGADELPFTGPLTVTVPGAVEAWFTLLDAFGTRSFAELAATPLAYARDGFALTTKGATYMRAPTPAATADWAQEWKSIYANARAGELLRQPAMARTIEALCNDGPEVYYRGPIGEAIAETLQSFGASMTGDDLAAHTGDWVTPISTTYRGAEIFELPPNSQGITVLEALNIVEDIDLGSPESAHRHHVLIEAAKIALSDRSANITDPAHMRIDPAMLASKTWASRRRPDIDPTAAGDPAAGKAAVGGTVYLCAADDSGMLVSLIQSNFGGFGSGVTVPEWGINLQNRGAYFSLDPDHVNVIAPSKRTMHTLMPGMAFRGGEPWLAFGSMGGDGQAQTNLQFLNRVVDDGRDVQDAIDAPRWRVSHTDWTVTSDPTLPREVVDGLRERGHVVDEAPVADGRMGHAHAIEVTESGYAAATDPRAEGAALGL